MKNWFHRLRHRAHDADLAEELHLHQEERAAELEAGGLSPQAARAEARREFGSPLRALEDSRAAWHLGWLEDLARDLHHGFRGLRRDPAFTLVSVASLALAIGVNTLIFSLAMEFFFSQPSIRDAAQVLSLQLAGDSHSSGADYRALHDSGLFSGVAGHRLAEINWRDGEKSHRLYANHVTGSYFRVLGIPLAAGRALEPADRQAAIVSARFWRQRLAADPRAIGRVLVLDGLPYTIIGILPEDHRTLDGFGFSPHLWIPANEAVHRLALSLRLPEGMSRAEAFARVRSFAAALDASRPLERGQRAENIALKGVTGFERLTKKNVGAALGFLALLLVAVNLVLLVSCVNVAGLLIARGQARRQEFAIRTSLGADTGRLVRQLLAETLLLSIGASLLGVAANLALTRLLRDVQLPLPVPIYIKLHPDWRLLAYASGLTALAALAAGLLPAWQTARASLLQVGQRDTGHGSRLRSLLVAGQVTVTFVVLAAALLFVRNLSLAAGTNPGFDPDRVLWASVRPPAGQTLSPHTRDLLRALPGIESISRVTVVPLNDQTTHRGPVHPEGVPEAITIRRQYNRVDPGYFQTMGIPLLAGREFQPGERRVAIVNDTFARRAWGRLDVAGRTLRSGDGPPVTIIGVCRTTKHFTLSEDDQPALYEPFVESPVAEWMIRTRDRPAALVQSVERLLLQQDPAASVTVKPMSSALGMALLPSQIGAGLMGALGLLGLALASLGLYGVLLHAVARRRRELGVRLALGASTAQIARLVLREVAGITGAGLALGLAIALLVTRPLAAFLVAGLATTDPVSYAGVIVLLAAVALAAALPALFRALRLDPVQVLRTD